MKENEILEQVERLNDLINRIENMGEDMTPEELELLTEEAERLEKKFKTLQKKFNTKTKHA